MCVRACVRASVFMCGRSGKREIAGGKERRQRLREKHSVPTVIDEGRRQVRQWTPHLIDVRTTGWKRPLRGARAPEQTIPTQTPANPHQRLTGCSLHFHLSLSLFACPSLSLYLCLSVSLSPTPSLAVRACMQKREGWLSAWWTGQSGPLASTVTTDTHPMHRTDHLNRHTTAPPSALSSRRCRPNTGLPCAVDTSRVYVSPRIAMHRTATTKPESGGVVRYVYTLCFLFCLRVCSLNDLDLSCTSLTLIRQNDC